MAATTTFYIRNIGNIVADSSGNQVIALNSDRVITGPEYVDLISIDLTNQIENEITGLNIPISEIDEIMAYTDGPVNQPTLRLTLSS